MLDIPVTIYDIIILTLQMKIKDVEDLDELWKMNVPCQHAHGAKLVLLCPAVFFSTKSLI